MVRINLISPKELLDQHLIAEYNEILKMLGMFRKCGIKGNPEKEFCLGKGHITFFYNKLLYIDKRFNAVKREMKKRGFKPTKDLDLEDFEEKQKKDWKPKKKDFEKIRERLKEKIENNPNYYRYKKRKIKPEDYLGKILKFE